MFKRVNHHFFSIVLLLAAQSPIVLAEPITAPEGLMVVGEVRTALTLSASDLTHLPRHKVSAMSKKGEPLVYEGVLLSDILYRAGAPQGEGLKGATMADFLLVEARDGYRVVFSLAEIDPAFGGVEVLLADRLGGKPLDTTEGPLRLVVPTEKRQARWVRQVQRLVVRHSTSGE